MLFALAAPRIKEMSRRQGAITLPALLRKQWTRKTLALASLVTIVIFATTLASNLLVVGNILVYLLIGVFSFFGSQDLYQRIYAARRPRDARRAMLLFAAVLAVMSAVAVALGIFARALVPAAAGDQAVVALIDAIVPSGLAGLILLGVLALANSDADSQLLTVTSNVTQDIPDYFGVEIAEEKQVWIDRAVVLGIGSVALLGALMAPGVAELLGALASWFAILGLAVVATLFWDRVTDTAAFAGILVGFLAPTVFITLTGNWQAAPLIGLIPAAVTIVGVSFLTSD